MCWVLFRQRDESRWLGRLFRIISLVCTLPLFPTNVNLVRTDTDDVKVVLENCNDPPFYCIQLCECDWVYDRPWLFCSVQYTSVLITTWVVSIVKDELEPGLNSLTSHARLCQHLSSCKNVCVERDYCTRFDLVHVSDCCFPFKWSGWVLAFSVNATCSSLILCMYRILEHGELDTTQIFRHVTKLP